MILKVISANSVDQDQSDLGPHCLSVCKNRFEKFARIFSRRHKQTFSDAGFLGVLRVILFIYLFFFFRENKISLDILCELSAWQTIHMKCRDLFSLKKKKKKKKFHTVVCCSCNWHFKG